MYARLGPFPTRGPLQASGSCCVSSFAALIVVIHAASPWKGTGKVSQHKQGSGSCGAPVSLCERGPGGAIRAIECRCCEPQRSHKQPVCSLKFSMSHLSP